MNDEGKPVRTAFAVTSGRVQHYSDVIEYMIADEIARCKTEGHIPSPQQIAFLRKELIRYIVIRRDLITAQKLRIRKTSLLFT